MKKKWYQSALCKGVLLVAAHAGIVAAAVCMVWLTLAAGVRYLNPFEKIPESYSGTTSFASDLKMQTSYILETMLANRKFETDGKLDRDKLVDLEEYMTKGTVSGENTSGAAYKLGDLVDWYGNREYEDWGTSSVIVCHKPDGTFHYYKWSDFETQIREGKLNFVDQTQELSYYLSVIENKYSDNRSDVYLGISDQKGTILYDDCWRFTGPDSGSILKERYTPQGAKSILDIVNDNEKWNGRLSELYKMLDYAVENIGGQVESYESMDTMWKEGSCNLAYLLIDEDNKQVYTNRAAYNSYKTAEEGFEKLKRNGDGTDANYVAMQPSLERFESNMDAGIKPSEWQNIAENFQEHYGLKNFKFIIAVDTSYPIQDKFYENQQDYIKIQPHIGSMNFLGWSGLILFLISLVWLTAVSGRSNREESEGVALNVIDKWPAELALISIIGGVTIFVAWLSEAMWRWNQNSYVVLHGSDMSGMYVSSAVNGSVEMAYLLATGAIVFAACFLGMLGYLSCVRRLKAHTFWKTCLVRRVFRWIVKFFQYILSGIAAFWHNRKLVTKKCVTFLGFLLIHYLAFAGWLFVFVMLIVDAVAFIFLIREAIAKYRVTVGIQKIAGGEVDYKIPTEGMKGENKDLAECVNNIGEGLHAAVEESLKSERLKTDLITNVSHDIKTPLTSIINYVELLKRENFDDPKIQGYLKVLEEKSQRLKTLTEDVVEASKISSGNINLEFMDLNLVEMIQQTSGEFLEKFEARDLKLVSNLPDHPVLIRADGRRMWRVLANIYNNAAKYAMQGTRVYADMTLTDNAVAFSLKNISEQALNISADELTERFIRGDVSRSTEGSGLGLSIAKNLTERQNGEFKLYLDGDLFKATIIFPRVIK